MVDVVDTGRTIFVQMAVALLKGLSDQTRAARVFVK